MKRGVLLLALLAGLLMGVGDRWPDIAALEPSHIAYVSEATVATNTECVPWGRAGTQLCATAADTWVAVHRPASQVELCVEVAVVPAVTTACDVTIEVYDSAQSLADTSTIMVYGGGTLDEIGERECLTLAASLAVGDWIQVPLDDDATTTACANGSGCACNTVQANFQLFLH